MAIPNRGRGGAVRTIWAARIRANTRPNSATPNVDWKAELPGKGCSTPVVVGEQILITCPVDGDDAVLSYDWTGKPGWQAKIGPEKPGKHRNGSAANPSPATDGQYPFAYFRSGNLAGLDLAGNVLWKTNLQERFAKDTALLGHRHFAGAHERSVRGGGNALRRIVPGRVREGQRRVTLEGVAELRNAGGRRSQLRHADRDRARRQTGDSGVGRGASTAHDAADGKILWSCAGFNPKKQGNWVVVASAIVAGDTAIVPYGRGSHLAGVRLGGNGDVTETHRPWTRNDTGTFVPSPAVCDGRLYLVKDGGEVECLNPQTGKTLWTDRFPKNPNNYYSSPMIAGGKLYAAREDGVVMSPDARSSQPWPRTTCKSASSPLPCRSKADCSSAARSTCSAWGSNFPG